MSQDTNESLEGNKLPTSLQQIGIIIRYEIRNYFRSRRFLILLIICLAIASLLTFFVAYRGISSVATDSLSLYSIWWGEPGTFVIVISAIFFGGDAISGEFQNKTGYFLIGNPVRRSTIYVGKWIAALIASLFAVGIYTAMAIANSAVYFGNSAFPKLFGEAFLFALVFLIAALGFTFFFSSVFKNSSMSILVAAIMLLFGFSVISGLSTALIKVEPWFVLTYGAGIMGNVLTTPFPKHEITTGFGNFTFTNYNATIAEGLAIMLIYFAITSVLGLLLFERKEFN